MSLRQAAQQARNALANARDYIYLLETGEVSWSEEEQLQEIAAAITALRAALAEPEPEQEPQTTHWEGCEAVHPECKTEHGVKDLSNYEFKTYKTGGAELEAGFYSTDELRDLVKALDKMNAVTERSMKRIK